MRVQKSLAERTPGKRVKIKMSENRTLDLSTGRKGKEENRKFVPGVLEKKISKSSCGKQKIGVGHSENILLTKQPGNQ